MRKLLYLILIIAAGYYAATRTTEQPTQAPVAEKTAHATATKSSRGSASAADARRASGSERITDLMTSDRDDSLTRAFERQQSNVPVHGAGSVAKILSDDNDGSRHQRFLVRLQSGQTILIAHNIDLARRVEPLAVGDRVEFSGEYAWNNKGGVVHWTHRDPSNRHQAGWIRHDGATFQ